MNLPALGAYTSSLDFRRDEPGTDLEPLRDRAGRRPSNAPLVDELRRIEARWGGIGIGLTALQARDLVQAKWAVERAWEALASDPETASLREDAQQWTREADLLSAFLSPPAAASGSRLRPCGLVIDPGVPGDERRCAEAFFARLRTRAMQAILGAMTIRIAAATGMPMASEPSRPEMRLSESGPRARFDEPRRTLWCAGTPEHWERLEAQTREMRRDPGRNPLPVLWYALGRALEASTSPRGSEDPDFLMSQMDSDWPDSLPRPDAKQEAAQILALALAEARWPWGELHGFLERMIGPAVHPSGRVPRR